LGLVSFRSMQIPGQYPTGGGAALMSPPRPELHTRLASLDPTVLTLGKQSYGCWWGWMLAWRMVVDG
jgi:hypothetical protein